MSYNLAMTITGEPQTTLTHTCGDTAETLDDISGFVFQVTKTVNGAPRKCNVVGCYITCATYEIAYAWGTNPVQAGVGHILPTGTMLRLTNPKQIADFRFINETNGEDAVLSVTPELSFV